MPEHCVHCTYYRAVKCPDASDDLKLTITGNYEWVENKTKSTQKTEGIEQKPKTRPKESERQKLDRNENCKDYTAMSKRRFHLTRL